MYLPPLGLHGLFYGERHKLKYSCLHNDNYVPVPEKRSVFSEVETEYLTLIVLMWRIG